MVVAEVSAACSGGALRVPARGTCSAVIMVAPTRAAASAWTGAIAGSLGAGWPRVTAISSMTSERAKTAHSSQAASARSRMIASSDSGLAKNRWACCHPGQLRGSGDPVILASPQGRPASRPAATAIPAAARSSRQASVSARLTAAARRCPARARRRRWRGR